MVHEQVPGQLGLLYRKLLSLKTKRKKATGLELGLMSQKLDGFGSKLVVLIFILDTDESLFCGRLGVYKARIVGEGTGFQ